MSTDTAGVQLVVFDLGRVLVRICDDWQHACRCVGLQVNASSLLLNAPALKKLSDAHEVGRIRSDDFLAQIAKVIGASPDHVRRASEAYTRGGYLGAAELVEELNAAGVRTACLTNTNEHHWQLLSLPGHSTFFPLDRLNYRFASHLIHCRKPDDAIYAHVERETGLPPSSILFFDDVLENVEAAARRGWHIHRVDPKFENPIPHIRSVLRQHGILPV
jgi:FMN phosphatase YigB (HAD superfamily)